MTSLAMRLGPLAASHAGHLFDVGVDELSLRISVERAADDLLGQLDREITDRALQLLDRARALGLHLLLGPRDDLLGLALGLLGDVFANLFCLAAGLLDYPIGLRASVGEILLVLVALLLGLVLGLLGLLEVLLDLLLARLDRLSELGKGELVEDQKD